VAALCTKTPVSLTVAQYAEAKGLAIQFLEKLGVREESTPHGPRIAIPYHDEDGREITTRYRHALDGKCFSWPKGTTTALYGLDRLKAAREVGFVVLVEGESDCHTLWSHHIPAVGVPGAPSGWKGRDANHFDGLGTIYVINEKDMASKSLLAKLKASAIRDRVRVVALVGAKDPSALYLDNPSAFADRFEAALRQAKPFTETETVPPIPLYLGEGVGSQGNSPVVLDQALSGRSPVRSSRENYNAYQRELMRGRRAAKRAAEASNDPETISPEGPPSPRYSGTAGTTYERDAVLNRIAQLRKFDEEAARAIIEDAVKAGFSSLMVETLIGPLADALGVKDAVAKKFWKDCPTSAPLRRI
jgi:hypothetical protein